jgi:two-component system response regulator HydG
MAHSGGSSKATCVVVIAGPDAGKTLVLADERPMLVGRAREADLVLTDAGVSRQHLFLARNSEGAVQVRVCEGARPVILDDREVSELAGQIGDRIVVGNTVLLITESEVQPAARGNDSSLTTNIHVLFGDLAGEVRGLSAIYSLNDALSAARDRDGVAVAMAQWCRTNAGVETVTIEDPADRDALSDSIVEQTSSSGTVIQVALRGEPPARIAFNLPLSEGGVVDSLRRLLALASALCASALSRIRAQESVERDLASFRQLAIGSARGFLGSTTAAQHVSLMIPRLAKSDVIVLLSGETGTGKSFVARLIHESGPRATEPFRTLNCAAIPESLIESELFGHERGAFTGAVSARTGALESAGSGTIFLDELGELPLTSQAKLLRVLEERLFERLGSNRAIPLNARVIAASNRDLKAMVEEGTFRSDLFFRIHVVNVTVPPLRERAEDIPALAAQILNDFRESTPRRITRISRAALDRMQHYPWPGNVRELRNAIEHAIALGESEEVGLADLPEALRLAAPPSAVSSGDPYVIRLPATLSAVETKAIQAALLAAGDNRKRAAVLLGIPRSSLYVKLAALTAATPGNEPEGGG